jgi:hypothetical protein
MSESLNVPGNPNPKACCNTLANWIRGLKLKSYAGQTDNFEIYGEPHAIFSNIKLSILFKIKHNIKTTPHYKNNLLLLHY